MFTTSESPNIQIPILQIFVFIYWRETRKHFLLVENKLFVNNFQTVFFVYCSVSTNLKGNSTWQYPVDKFFDKMLNKINLQVLLKQSMNLSGTLRSSTIYDWKYFFFLPDLLQVGSPFNLFDTVNLLHSNWRLTTSLN